MAAASGPNVVEDGLVLSLDAGNTESYPGSGTDWTDLIGSNNGTLTNGPTYNSDNGGYLQFPNSNSYIQLSSPALTTPTSLSVDMWVKITDTSVNSIFLSNRDSNTDGFEARFDSTNKWSFQINGGVTNFASATVNQDQWYHFAFTFDGTYGKIFVDGVLIKTVHHGSQTINATTSSTIGAVSYQTSSVQNKFKIAKLRVYNRELTEAEILQNYNATRGRYVSYLTPIVTSGLILHLDAANTSSYSGSGTTWTDLIGSTNGTLTNGPTFSSDNNGYLDFDGTDDFVTLGTQINSDIITTDVTISFWAYIDSTANDEIFVSMESLAVGEPLIIWYDTSSIYEVQNTGSGDVGGGSTNVITTAVDDNGSEKRFTTSNNALSATTWYNIAVVLDVTNNAFYTYINGVEEAKWVSNNTSGGIKSTTNDFRIGGNPSLDGRISQFLVYNKALTAAEVLQNYKGLKERYGY